MAAEVTKEEILKAAGIAKAPAPTTLDNTTKVLNILNNPLASKWVDRILERIYRKYAPEERSSSAGTSPPAKTPPQTKVNLSGTEIMDFFVGWIETQDDKITMGQFKAWLKENKTGLSNALDKAMKIL